MNTHLCTHVQSPKKIYLLRFFSNFTSLHGSETWARLAATTKRTVNANYILYELNNGRLQFNYQNVSGISYFKRWWLREKKAITTEHFKVSMDMFLRDFWEGKKKSIHIVNKKKDSNFCNLYTLIYKWKSNWSTSVFQHERFNFYFPRVR